MLLYLFDPLRTYGGLLEGNHVFEPICTTINHCDDSRVIIPCISSLFYQHFWKVKLLSNQNSSIQNVCLPSDLSCCILIGILNAQQQCRPAQWGQVVFYGSLPLLLRACFKMTYPISIQMSPSELEQVYAMWV